MDHYVAQSVIEDLKMFVVHKEKELLDLQIDMINDNTIKINQLTYEINELKMQIRYHENMISDIMKSKSCCTGCCCYY